VQERPLRAVEFIRLKPLVASVADAKDKPTDRVIVWETARHHLQCSFHGGRKFLCAHAVACAMAIESVEVKARLCLEFSQHSNSVRQRLHPAPVDVRDLTLAFKVATPVPFPVKPNGFKVPKKCLPSLPVDCKCGHTAACLERCDCNNKLRITELGETSLFDIAGISTISVCQARCACRATQQPTVADAVAQGIFPHGALWLTFNLLRMYDLEFDNQGATFDGFCKTQTAFWGQRSLDGAVTFSKSVFIDCWWDWNRARDLPYDEAFSCQKCDALPWAQRAFVLDVTRLGVKRDRFIAAQCAECWDEKQPLVAGWYSCGTLMF
jgi:hypothetical protein